MPAKQRIYLDNAATSWPKPQEVYEAVERYQREIGAPAGRGVYREAGEVERLLNNARRRVAQLIGAEEPNRVIFTFNGTDSLNLALHGLLKNDDHVVTTVAEHNSVLRPLRWLEENRGISVTRVECSGAGIVDPDDIRSSIKPQTKLITVLHASNVTGAVQPVETIGRIAKEHDVLLLVDGAQSLGHIPIDVAAIGSHLLAASGHKGLLGPLGTGVLYVAPGIEEQLNSLRQGGTGTQSEEDRQPDSLPDKYEAGNHNLPGIVGLGAGVAYLQDRGMNEIRRHEQHLIERLLAGLETIDGVTIYGPNDAYKQLGVVSIRIDGYDPQEVASTLDATCGIQVRAGLHCAPLMHRSLGTIATGGTVRFSPGPFNTEAQIEQAVKAVAELASTSIEV